MPALAHELGWFWAGVRNPHWIQPLARHGYGILPSVASGLPTRRTSAPSPDADPLNAPDWTHRKLLNHAVALFNPAMSVKACPDRQGL